MKRLYGHDEKYKCIFVSVVSRVPLIKHKTIREEMQEKGQWEDFRRRFPYNPFAKFDQTLHGAEQMTNDVDVSGHFYQSFFQYFFNVFIFFILFFVLTVIHRILHY